MVVMEDVAMAERERAASDLLALTRTLDGMEDGEIERLVECVRGIEEVSDPLVEGVAYYLAVRRGRGRPHFARERALALALRNLLQLLAEQESLGNARSDVRVEWASLILDDCGEAEPAVERALMAGRALTGALDLLSGPELRRVRDELRNERWMSAHIIAGIRDYVDDHQRRP